MGITDIFVDHFVYTSIILIGLVILVIVFSQVFGPLPPLAIDMSIVMIILSISTVSLSVTNSIHMYLAQSKK